MELCGRRPRRRRRQSRPDGFESVRHGKRVPVNATGVGPPRGRCGATIASDVTGELHVGREQGPRRDASFGSPVRRARGRSRTRPDSRPCRSRCAHHPARRLGLDRDDDLGPSPSPCGRREPSYVNRSVPKKAARRHVDDAPRVEHHAAGLRRRPRCGGLIGSSASPESFPEGRRSRRAGPRASSPRPRRPTGFSPRRPATRSSVYIWFSSSPELRTRRKYRAAPRGSGTSTSVSTPPRARRVGGRDHRNRRD